MELVQVQGRLKGGHNNGPYKTTKHHRKPESLGGDCSPRNISSVPRYQHEAWHLLFDSLPAEQMFVKFLFFLDIFGVNTMMPEFQTRHAKAWVRTKKSRIKKQQAWIYLFGDLDVEEIVKIINTVWIDPDYKFIIRVERVKRIRLVAYSRSVKIKHC